MPLKSIIQSTFVCVYTYTYCDEAQYYDYLPNNKMLVFHVPTKQLLPIQA